MPVPKRKTSKRVKGNRAAHRALVAPSLKKCPQCSERIPSHRVCPECGFYKGKEIYNPEN